MAPTKAISLKLHPPTGDRTAGRGFYQLEEETLFVQVGAFRAGLRYFSFLESEHCRLEFDRAGRLIFVELSVPRRRWKLSEEFTPPTVNFEADIRILNFRENISEPLVSCNKNKDQLRIQFQSTEVLKSIQLAESVIVDVSETNTLLSIWITSITDDMAGQHIASFRHSLISP